MKQKRNWSVLLGAAFLMATSAVGPGFLTQTTVFTQSLAASFGFVILVSIILDIGVQLNVWRVIAVSEKRAQDIANMLFPGLGLFVAVLIVLGGFAFNIGNVGGAGLGFNVLFGISPELGAIITAAVAIGIFLVREAKKVMDRFAQVMGLLMILLIVYVAITSSPPLAEAAVKTFLPDQIDFIAIITLVGGTVGGYITFAGGHRLLDAGVKGEAALPEVNTSAVSGITIASIIRIFLFLAALGVVSKGLILDESNPPASVFQLAAGNVGYKLFGIVMVSAAITSVIGSAYTSVSFIKSFHTSIERYENWFIIGFIVVSTAIFVTIGRPVHLLILAGALNGLILPLTLGTILIAAHKTEIIGRYKHPLWLTVFGVLVVLVMAWMGGYTLVKQLPALFG
ncbi:NRAMP family divalent metal transporter [Pontibacter sp. HSC-36F09]|uniref:NRAMP family divalent metal transporter n=1 Tax=Pontibacter sp. HSC-36F09 TaxID=2910966 RepID=UPI0020A12EC1|nr:NRAMP family divalent metal transporter [Pontibacter sp. HSC-36F09]MCP2042178.1 Mn2+/Fe2+ NRAMP family transporter [Pontibacter sp. HSC-36F09]